MTGARREGKRSKEKRPKTEKKNDREKTSEAQKATDASAQFDTNLKQIEYLLYQSTQGVHFIFDNSEIAKILCEPTDEKRFFTSDNMQRVQGLLSSFIEKPSLQEKRSYLESLPLADYQLMIRAYFHLVENTILAHSSVRH